MPNFSVVSNDALRLIRKDLSLKHDKVRAWHIKEAVKEKFKVDLDESTIRGRFVEMGEPLSSRVKGLKSATKEETQPTTKRADMMQLVAYTNLEVKDDLLKSYIPRAEDFVGYVSRDVDNKLAVHLNIGPKTGRYKYPLSQGKQGTGKTQSFKRYAWKGQLPFFLFSCYEDFKLRKLFGDKSIKNGSIIFQESLFVLAIQNPSVVVFDEINAVSNSQTFDWHALLQERELFVKDADDGKGKIYHLHPECRIGFAQNPKSAKYIGGNIKPSNFLGRCTHLTYPEFTKKQLTEAITKVFPSLERVDLDKFIQYYYAITEVIEKASIPVDISIRQLINIIDLWIHGLPLMDALSDGMISILDSISQPKAKDSFVKIAQTIWKELM